MGLNNLGLDMVTIWSAFAMESKSVTARTLLSAIQKVLELLYPAPPNNIILAVTDFLLIDGYL